MPATAAAPIAVTYRPLTGFAGILRSEFLKLASVRSTLWTLLTAIAANVVLAALAAVLLPGRLSDRQLADVDPLQMSLAGLHISQVAFGVLGVLAITGEYGTGTIRATLAAVPQRRTVLTAKALVFTGTALAAGVVSSFAAFFVFQAFLSDSTLNASLGDPGVLRAVLGGGLYPTVLGLLGLGLGIVLRSSAGAIATLCGLLFVPPILLGLLPDTWRETVGPYVPMRAGEQIYILRSHEAGLGAWPGFGVFGLYAAAGLALGFILIRHRDA